MSRYSVIWNHAAEQTLAELWLNNPRIRQDITDACDQLENGLAEQPSELGIVVSTISRLVTHPPISILYRVVEEDRQVRVLHVKFWLE
jgi:hypothetical protein